MVTQVEELAVGGRSSVRAAAEPYNEPQQGKIVVDCVIYPTRNRRRIFCTPSTTFFSIAADLEASLAVPAVVCSFTNLEGSVGHPGPLPFAKTLSGLGLKADDRVALDVNLLRKPTCSLEGSPGIEGRCIRHTEKTDEKIARYCLGDSRLQSADSYDTKQGITGRRLAAGDREMSNNGSGRCAVEAPWIEAEQKMDANDSHIERAKGSFSNHLLEAVTRWQAFSSDSLEPIPIAPVKRSQTTRSTQTIGETPSPQKTKFHTETQTHVWGNSAVQPKREAAVQMQKRGLHISETEDKVLKPSGAYEDADTLDRRKSEKSIIIQAFVRRVLAQKKAQELRKIKQEQAERLAAGAAKERREKALLELREETRCLRPETYDDFRTLYQGLEAWRQQEAKRIKQILHKETHQRAFIELLHKETEVLQHIEGLKIKAKQENKDEKIGHILDTLAEPLEWLSTSTGKIMTVHTPETMRAGELRDLYVRLKAADTPPKRRLDTLLNIRERVAATASERGVIALIREFDELIGREIEWLQRGRTNNARLSGLRQRLIHAFWYLIQTPQFNPQATRYLKLSNHKLLAC